MKRMLIITAAALAAALAAASPGTSAAAVGFPMQVPLGTVRAQAQQQLQAQTGKQPPAQAKPAECTVTEIWASNDAPAGVDPKLARLKSKLGGFKWTTFKQLGESQVTAPPRKPVSATLTNGGKANLLYKEKIEDGAKARMRVNMEVLDKDGTQILSVVFTLDSGDATVISGEPEPKGVYMLAVGCTLK